MADITIRRLKPDDTDLNEIAKHLNSNEWEKFEHLDADFSTESFKKFLQDKRHIYLIGYAEGQIAGAAHGYVFQHPAGPTYLYVDEVDTALSHRRQGVANAMMQEMFKFGGEADADEVWLGTEQDNEPAKALYEGLSPSEIEHGPIYSYKLKK